MNDFVLVGLSIVLSFMAWGIFCYQYVWPRIALRAMPEATRPLLYLHLFRFVGASFLIPGVVAPELPRTFAAPGAYGDLIAVAFAWVALLLLRQSVGTAALWIFNVWGTADLLFAFYQGLFNPAFHPSLLGATFFIPTLGVPLLICTHIMIFVMLLRRGRSMPASP